MTDNRRRLEPLTHPAYVCSGAQLETVMAELEAGSMPPPDVPVWRPDDLPMETAVRLARATGATAEEVADAQRDFRA